jgi:hypothetical protein
MLLPFSAQINNSGSYSWSVPSTIGNGQYTLEITDIAAPSDGNYSPLFTVSGGAGKQGALPPEHTSNVVSVNTATIKPLSTGSSGASSTGSSAATTTGSGSSKATATGGSAAPTSGAGLRAVPVAALFGGVLLALA